MCFRLICGAPTGEELEEGRRRRRSFKARGRKLNKILFCLDRGGYIGSCGLFFPRPFPTYPRFRGGSRASLHKPEADNSARRATEKRYNSLASFSLFLLRLSTSPGGIELHHSVLPRLIHDSRHEASHVRSHLEQARSHQLETQRAVLAAGRIGCDKRMARPYISAIPLVARASWFKHTGQNFTLF